MASFSRLLLWRCVLLCLSPFATASNPTTGVVDPLTGEYLTCNPNFRIRLESETQTPHKDCGKGPDQFLERIMELILNTCKESGMHCTSDKPSYMVICCVTGNLGQFNNIQDITASNKSWYHDMQNINFLVLFLNVVLFMVVLSLILIREIKCSGVGARSPPSCPRLKISADKIIP